MRKKRIEGRDFIIVGLTSFDVPYGSNCKNIAEEIARNNRVLFVNRPLDRISFLRKRKDTMVQKRLSVLRGEETDLVQSGENFWNLYPKTVLESVNWFNVSAVFDFFNKINNRRIARQIKKAVEKLSFRDVIILNDNDIFKSFYLKEFIQPEKYVYYIRDYLIGLEYWARQGRRLEEQLIRKSDLVVANSMFLQAYCAQFNDRSYYVGQGCAISHFKDALWEVPEDLKDKASPIIAYIGSLDSNRLDINLIVAISKSHSDWSLVLIGPEDKQFKESVLHQLDNVYFLGNKKFEDLPAYIKHIDVCMNPQKNNALTIGNYPRKIDEYLAMGKATVATKTKTMEAFKEHVYLAESAEAFITLIEKAIREDSAEKVQKRKAFAREHTWENSVGAIYDAIVNVEAFNKQTVLEGEDRMVSSRSVFKKE